MTDVTHLRFPPGLLAAAPYVPDWQGLPRERFIRLDRNESTRALSPRVADAVTAAVAGTAVLSYPHVDRLLEPLAAYCGVSPAQVLPTNGSDQAIDIVLRCFLPPGGEVLLAVPAFPVFPHLIGVQGGRLRAVPYDPDLTFPYEAFRAEALSRRPDMVIVITPNNPTGTAVRGDFITGLAEALPDVPVVVDEAYQEFTGDTVVPALSGRPNLMVLRTFSKAFAMAGLRLGYLVADAAVIAQAAKLRNPFDVNEPAVVAGLTQLRHLGEMHDHVTHVMRVAKPRTERFLRQRGVRYWPGAANFMLVRPDPPLRAADAVGHLQRSGILVRTMSAPQLAGTFRVSIGTAAEMREFCAAYDRFLDGAPPRWAAPGPAPDDLR
jgi:histidinol-phosphate aminotransferase